MGTASSLRSLFCLTLIVVMTALVVGCSDDDVVLSPPDRTPPATSALRIEVVTDSSLTITWRAPGDDDLAGGLVEGYDLRYSTAPFDETTWTSAAAATGLPRPTPSGTRQLYVLYGVEPGVTYFLALRSVDDSGNKSEPSSLINLTVPESSDDPVLWQGGLVPQEGTTATGFVYRVRLRLDGGMEVPRVLPEVVIDGVAHEMRFVESDDIASARYELGVELAQGSHEYYFTFTDVLGRTSRLPSPGQWTGPTVSDVSSFIPDQVSVPADTFSMGNPLPSPASPQEERPRHEVALTHNYFVDRYEISNAQLCTAFNWALARSVIEVLEDTIATAEGKPVLFTAPRREDVLHGISFSAETGFTPLPNREDWPATFVTWYGAALYCNIRSIWEGLPPAYDTVTWQAGTLNNPYTAEGWRLPTEAEWEYMAQYDDGRQYPSGNAEPRPGIDANFAGVVGSPSPIGSYPEGASGLGLRDLSGNVWEWCHDWKGYYSSGLQTNPTGARSGTHRIVRGGSWGSPVDELLCYRRFSMRPTAGMDGLGFRCVRSAS